MKVWCYNTQTRPVLQQTEKIKMSYVYHEFCVYREIFGVLDLMKLDMVNFAISSIRPHLMKQSVDYERKCFQEFFDKQHGESKESFLGITFYLGYSMILCLSFVLNKNGTY